MRKWTALIFMVLAATLPTGASAGPDCLCRADGRFFRQGELFCIRAPGGQRLVRCAMSQNVTTWDVVEDNCPTVDLTPLTEKHDRLARIVRRSGSSE